MTKKRVFMLGAGFMQGVAIRAAHALGCTVVAADGNPSAVCATEADEFVCIDLKDTARLIDYARYLQQNGGLDAVFTAATDFSAAVAAIAAACGLRGHTLEAALNATNKVRMRECFRKADVPSPAFIELTVADLAASAVVASSTAASADRLEATDNVRYSDTGAITDDALERRLGELAGRFPLVVKPVDNMGARGCSLVKDMSGLREAATTALRYSRSGRVIVEEYVEGSEFSIEGLAFGGRLYITALADRHIFFPPYFIEMGHTIPSECPQAIADEVISVFERGVHALGLTDGAVKGDILLRDGKAFVGEIAARLSGGYMSGWTVPYSCGLDITAAALTLALGGSPRLHSCGRDSFVVPLKQNCQFVSAERAWISIPGQVAAVSGLEAARAAPFIKDVFPRAGVGDTVVFPQNNVEKCGNVLSAAPSRREAVQASEIACRKIVLRLKPHVAETDAFLAELHSPAEQQTFSPNFLQFTEPLVGAEVAAKVAAEVLTADPAVARISADVLTADPTADRKLQRVADCSVDSSVFFDRLLADAVYEEEDGFCLPDFLAAALDSACDLQGRTLRELLHQALMEEQGLAPILCASESTESFAISAISLAEANVSAPVSGRISISSAMQRKNGYWKALIRGGLQGLLYRYDCEKA
ncbi:ATP-grasp domain-containing protein [Treponema medium]|uniref:ATP-grasp domain-containing protein n=1 Tax=Treponema medium TaxID=58231 RepID=UPI00197FDF54|nr:ATP-grasp domain-containing protein [Treponema medium]QSH93192.1 ATP-grasp domain-containing protein [Treponema medium]